MFGEFHALVGLVWMIDLRAVPPRHVVPQPQEDESATGRAARGAEPGDPTTLRSVVPAAVAAGFASSSAPR